MYIKSIQIENFGPFNKLDYRFKFKDGKPIPSILIGINGCGKTLFLSSIYQAFLRLKQKMFDNIPEVEPNTYFKMVTTSYTESNYTFISVDSNIGTSSNLAIQNLETFRAENLSNRQWGCIANPIQSVIEENTNLCKTADDGIFLYFPVDRFYYPAWLNSTSEKVVSESLKLQRLYGFSAQNSIIHDLGKDIESWILDIVIDSILYENENQGSNLTICHRIHVLINQIITRILCLKDSSIVSARFAVEERHRRKVSILVKNSHGEERYYVPDFSHLSTGELTIFSMALNIIKNYDKNHKYISDLKNIYGVVLIDEIEQGLHIDLIKEILPELIRLFPKVQFIVSTHSPFFMLGMKEKYVNEDVRFIHLPSGEEIEPENFSEIDKLYNIANVDYEKLLKEKNELRIIINNQQRPLIIGEGKTDRIHLENALQVLKRNKELQDDIEFEFKEIDNGGYSQLKKALETLKVLNPSRPVIGVFDCDVESVCKDYGVGNLKEIGNNVFAYVIKNVTSIPGGISIEFLYDDAVLKTSVNGRRLYFSNEFSSHSYRLIDNADVNLVDKHGLVDEFYNNKKIVIIDKYVFDSNENSIALSKTDFADAIKNKREGFENIDYHNFKDLFEDIYNQLGKQRKQ